MGKTCCGPSTCCSCKEETRRIDACMCGCAYLNGGMSLSFVLFFSLMAGLLSVGSMVDCSFATIDPTILALGDGLEIEAGGVGFLFVQKTNGHCYFYNYAADESKLQAYWDLLGGPWKFASIVTWTCACCSWFIFLYSITFCCSSQIKQIRQFLGFAMAGLMTIGQASIFIVYSEDFCRDYNCSFSRGSGTSLAAIACYIVAGLGFFFTKDYPGNEDLGKLNQKKTQQSDPESVEEDREYEYQDEIYSDGSNNDDNEGFSV